MLKCCVRRRHRLSVTLCIVAKRCVLEQKLLLSACSKSYEKSIGTKMNHLDLCLDVVSYAVENNTHSLSPFNRVTK